MASIPDPFSVVEERSTGSSCKIQVRLSKIFTKSKHGLLITTGKQQHPSKLSRRRGPPKHRMAFDPFSVSTRKPLILFPSSLPHLHQCSLHGPFALETAAKSP